MARPKQLEGETALLHIVIEKKMLDRLRMAAAKLSLKETRLVTASEAARLAIDMCYPENKEEGMNQD